jgi:hypothetical protein
MVNDLCFKKQRLKVFEVREVFFLVSFVRRLDIHRFEANFPIPPFVIFRITLFDKHAFLIKSSADDD